MTFSHTNVFYADKDFCLLLNFSLHSHMILVIAMGGEVHITS